MTIALDHSVMNHFVVATRLAMSPLLVDGRHGDTDTLFMAGTPLSATDREALAAFAMDKHTPIVFATFDPADLDVGVAGYDVVFTDGATQSIVLTGGQLWKRDRRSPAILLFPKLGVAAGLSSCGCSIVREISGNFGDRGYALARQAVTERAGRRPGQAPVVLPIENLMTVIDFRAMIDSFALAA